mgnify:CR=1 FL=1
MDCRDRIHSNSYYDVITDFPIELEGLENLDLCYVNIDNLYNIAYINRQSIRNVNEYIFDYKSVPKLYGLMQEESASRGFDPNSLIVSGITQAQREPLNLTGRGVVICVIDTGDCVCSLSEGALPEDMRFGATSRECFNSYRDKDWLAAPEKEAAK